MGPNGAQREQKVGECGEQRVDCVAQAWGSGLGVLGDGEDNVSLCRHPILGIGRRPCRARAQAVRVRWGCSEGRKPLKVGGPVG